METSNRLQFQVQQLVSHTWKRATGFNWKFNIWFHSHKNKQLASIPGSTSGFTHMEMSNRLNSRFNNWFHSHQRKRATGFNSRFNNWFHSHENEQLASIPSSTSGFTRMETSNWLQFKVPSLSLPRCQWEPCFNLEIKPRHTLCHAYGRYSSKV